MSLVVATLVRDEMRRFWPRTLTTWATFADDIVVLDDGSTDGTREAAEDAGAYVITTDRAEAMWGREAPARRRLFEAAWDFSKMDDYIFWLDGDMIPARNPRMLTETGADGVLFRLFDLWEPSRFRSDEFWRGHLFPRVWMVKKTPKDRDLEWPTRGIHCGHLPQNFPLNSYAYAPQDYSLLHYAYVSEELRADKYAEYAKVSSDLTAHEREHARSIMDPDPHIETLPFEPELTLV